MGFPFVSVVTPVYNGEMWLQDCIESVLAQDYENFEYHIVNNCSTDASLTIAERYARTDSRIRVMNNCKFVSAIENYNICFSLVAQRAAYCKAVSADDWIFPNCIGSLVRHGLRYPNVGIVGCYQRSGNAVRWQGVPPSVEVMSGRDAGRLGLLSGVHILGNATSVIYRADLLRSREFFYPHLYSHADTSACYEALQHCDFGFVHEILCEERVHQQQWSSAMHYLDAGNVAYLDVLLRYGPVYLEAAEFTMRKKQVFEDYYRWLGGCIWKFKRPEFWRFHQSRLAEMGCDFNWASVAKAAVGEAVEEARDPVTAMRKIVAAVKGTERA